MKILQETIEQNRLRTTKLSPKMQSDERLNRILFEISSERN